jgi:hypothetical protein
VKMIIVVRGSEKCLMISENSECSWWRHLDFDGTEQLDVWYV